MSNVPAELRYTRSHEWVDITNGVCTVGLTDHAQEALGDLVFVNLPQVGDEVVAGEALADVESVKAVSDILSPVTGSITEVNEELLDAPERINEDPYGSWVVRIGDVSQTEELLDADGYEKLCESGE